MRRGTYINVAGPTYETKHEVAALRTLGADASTLRIACCKELMLAPSQQHRTAITHTPHAAHCSGHVDVV